MPPLFGSLLLWLVLAGMVTWLARRIMRLPFVPGPWPTADAMGRVLIGTVALLLSLWAAHALGSAGELRNWAVQTLYGWIDVVLGGITELLRPLGVTELPTALQLVRNALVWLGVARQFDPLPWHFVLLVPPAVLVLWWLARNALLSAGGLAGWIVARFGKSLPRGLQKFAVRCQKALQDVGIRVERHEAIHRAVRWTAIGLGVFGVSLPFLLLAVDSSFGTAWRQGAVDLIWIGGFIMLLELWDATRPPDSSTRTVASAVPASPGAKTHPRSVDDLAKVYDDMLGDAILLKHELPALRGSDDMRTPFSRKEDRFTPLLDWLHQEVGLERQSLDDLAGGLAAVTDTNRALLFDETLAEPHYRVLVELIQIAQDTGGTTLVICPNGTAEKVDAALGHASRVFFGDLIHRTCVLGRDLPNAQELVHLVIVPEGSFTDLLDRLVELDAWYRRLALIVGLELSRLDLPLLRLRLARLFPEAPATGRWIMAQGEGLADIETLVRDIFGLGEHAVRPLRLHPEQATRRVIRVFDGSVKTAERLVNHLFKGLPPLDPLPLLLVPAWHDDWPVLHFDPDRRRDREAWSELANTYLGRSLDLRRLQARPQAQLSRHYLGAGEALPVAFTEDPGNLVIPVMRAYAYARLDELFLGIVARDYPLRGLLRDEIEKAETTGPLEAWLPMAPVPQVGLVELAFLLLPRLCQPKEEEGLDRDRLEVLLGQAPYQLLTALSIGPNLWGVRRLFEALCDDTGETPHIDRQEGAPERYTIPPDDQALARNLLNFDLPVEIAGRQLPLRLPKGDHGLTFAANTLLMIPDPIGEGGEFYRVVHVDRNYAELAPVSYLERTRTRPAYVFARCYRLELEPGKALPEAKDTSRVRGQTLEVSHLHACFTRTTEGLYELPEGVRPFADEHTPPFDDLYPPPMERRRYHSVLHLRFTGAGIDAGTLGDVAFTFCILLHDLLTALFPRHAHQLAVLSPQAASHYARAAEADADPLHQFLVRRYGWMELAGKAETQALDIFLVEDADHDLGVARAVRLKLDVVLERLNRYAGWLLNDSKGRPPFHAFGGKEAPAWLAVKGAQELWRPFLP